MELGIEDEEKKLYKKTEDVAENVLDNLNKENKEKASRTYRSSSTKNNITINVYPQKLDNKELDNIFNYVNRKFGDEY